MASLPLRADYPSPAPSRPAPSNMVGSSRAPQTRFSALEWSIVALAERDGLASIRTPNRMLSALGSIFGYSPPNRLANDRLEILRRVAIFAWNGGWNVPKKEVSDFIEAGFTTDHFELIQLSISEARRGRRRKTVR